MMLAQCGIWVRGAKSARIISPAAKVPPGQGDRLIALRRVLVSLAEGEVGRESMKRWLLYAVCLSLLLSAPTALLHAQAAQTPLWPSGRPTGGHHRLKGMPVAEKLQV